MMKHTCEACNEYQQNKVSSSCPVHREMSEGEFEDRQAARIERNLHARHQEYLNSPGNGEKYAI